MTGRRGVKPDDDQPIIDWRKGQGASGKRRRAGGNRSGHVANAVQAVKKPKAESQLPDAQPVSAFPLRPFADPAPGDRSAATYEPSDAERRDPVVAPIFRALVDGIVLACARAEVTQVTLEAWAVDACRRATERARASGPSSDPWALRLAQVGEKSGDDAMKSRLVECLSLWEAEDVMSGRALSAVSEHVTSCLRLLETRARQAGASRALKGLLEWLLRVQHINKSLFIDLDQRQLSGLHQVLKDLQSISTVQKLADQVRRGLPELTGYPGASPGARNGDVTIDSLASGSASASFNDSQKAAFRQGHPSPLGLAAPSDSPSPWHSAGTRGPYEHGYTALYVQPTAGPAPPVTPHQQRSFLPGPVQMGPKPYQHAVHAVQAMHAVHPYQQFPQAPPPPPPPPPQNSRDDYDPYGLPAVPRAGPKPVETEPEELELLALHRPNVSSPPLEKRRYRPRSAPARGILRNPLDARPRAQRSVSYPVRGSVDPTRGYLEDAAYMVPIETREQVAHLFSDGRDVLDWGPDRDGRLPNPEFVKAVERNCAAGYVHSVMATHALIRTTIERLVEESQGRAWQPPPTINVQYPHDQGNWPHAGDGST
jgi:hypothetical protein